MIIQPAILTKALDAALSTGADFADIFIEDTYSSMLGLRNGSADQAIVGQLYGAGIRLFFGTEIIYVTCNDLSEAGLVKAALLAAKSRGSQSALYKPSPFQPHVFDSLHTFGDKPWEVHRDRKFAWLNSLDQNSRAASSFVTQVKSNLNEKFQKVQIANSKGLLAYDERAYSRLTSEVFVEKDGKMESSYQDAGHMGTSEIYDQINLKKIAEENAKRAMTLVDADYAPAGEMPVIISNGFGGVIFHEASGHGLETTSVAKGSSVFSDKLGQKIGNDCLTAIDDGTIANEWGSLNIDDEGNKTQRTTLIEKGVVKSFMVDEMGSRETGYAITGSGRRQSYKFAPASRMRNTFIAPGADKFEDMVKDIDFGIYAKTMGGGSVSPGTGDYNFQVREAYMIRNGRLEEAVKGACLIGRGIETLGKITKVSDEMTLGRGMCGSVSGYIPAGLGQPELLVSSLMVGGRVK